MRRSIAIALALALSTAAPLLAQQPLDCGKQSLASAVAATVTAPSVDWEARTSWKVGVATDALGLVIGRGGAGVAAIEAAARG